MKHELTVEIFDSYVDRFKAVAFTTLASLKQLEQINKLIEENNRILLQNVVLFKTLQRTITQSAIINIAMFTDRSHGAFNLHFLAGYLKKYKQRFAQDNTTKLRIIDEELKQINALTSDATRTKIKNLRDKIYGHLDRELIKEEGKYLEFLAANNMQWPEVRIYLERVGTLLNNISGALLDKGTIMGIAGDGITYPQFQALEKAELIEEWLTLEAAPEIEEQSRAYIKRMLTNKR